MVYECRAAGRSLWKLRSYRRHPVYDLPGGPDPLVLLPGIQKIGKNTLTHFLDPGAVLPGDVRRRNRFLANLQFAREIGVLYLAAVPAVARVVWRREKAAGFGYCTRARPGYSDNRASRVAY